MFVIHNFSTDIGTILNDNDPTGISTCETLLQTTVHYTSRDLQQAVFVPLKCELCKLISGLTLALPSLSCHLTPAARILGSALQTSNLPFAAFRSSWQGRGGQQASRLPRLGVSVTFRVVT